MAQAPADISPVPATTGATAIAAAPAQEPAALQSAVQNSTIDPLATDFSLWRSLGAFLIVIGLLFSLTWLLKRHGGRKFGIGGDKRIRVIERHMLGPKLSLVIARVDNRDILLGVSSTSITQIDIGNGALPSVQKEEK